MKGKRGHPQSQEARDKIRKAHLGKIVSESTRQKLSESHRGEKSVLWKGGIYKTNNELRRSGFYKTWQQQVYKRDNYTCLACGATDKKLNANHIKKFSDYPELRFVVSNGITLCEDCHKIVTGKENEYEDFLYLLLKLYV